MGLPGHRRTSSHKRRRASHFAVSPKNLTTCPRCKNPILPHTACRSCGYYKGREVVKMPVVKTSAKNREKKEHQHEHKK